MRFSPQFLKRLRERGVRGKDFYSLWRILVLKTRYGKRLQLSSIAVGLEATSRILLDRHAGIRFGQFVTVRKRTDIEVYDAGVVEIGNCVFINKDCMIVCRRSVHIGSDCMLSTGVAVYDHNFYHQAGPVPFKDQGFDCKPVWIGNNVWIGARCFIRAGVTIGNNVVIGAGTVVTRDIPSNSLAFGRTSLEIRPLDHAHEELQGDATTPRQFDNFLGLSNGVHGGFS